MQYEGKIEENAGKERGGKSRSKVEKKGKRERPKPDHSEFIQSNGKGRETKLNALLKIIHSFIELVCQSKEGEERKGEDSERRCRQESVWRNTTNHYKFSRQSINRSSLGE